jgi:hypothetical protein
MDHIKRWWPRGGGGGRGWHRVDKRMDIFLVHVVLYTDTKGEGKFQPI